MQPAACSPARRALWVTPTFPISGEGRSTLQAFRRRENAELATSMLHRRKPLPTQLTFARRYRILRTLQRSMTAHRFARREISNMDLLIFLLVGAVAGWLAGLIVRGFGFGLIGNIVVGIIGALAAGYLFPRLGIGLPAGMIGEILSAVVGAVIVLVIIGFIRRA
jgi:uncharacterized membrane protein YeaQ/YmgE (transglycosylase-associated protein family)